MEFFRVLADSRSGVVEQDVPELFLQDGFEAFRERCRFGKTGLRKIQVQGLKHFRAGIFLVRSCFTKGRHDCGELFFLARTEFHFDLAQMPDHSTGVENPDPVDDNVGDGSVKRLNPDAGTTGLKFRNGRQRFTS